MDKSWLMTQPGTVRTETVKVGGVDRLVHFKARAPNEIASHFGNVQALAKDGATSDSAVGTQREIARFIADSLCNEDGTPFITQAEAEKIAPQVKNELRGIIVEGSSKTISELGNA